MLHFATYINYETVFTTSNNKPQLTLKTKKGYMLKLNFK